MNKFIVAVAAAFVLVGSASAAEAPESKVFDAKQGKVTFPHKAHAEKLKGDCKACHDDAKGGKIAGWGKDKAHGLCKKCHETEKKGPTKCNECHKKG